MGVVKPDSIWWASRRPDDADDESWLCPTCRHCYERRFDVNTMSFRLGQVIPPVVWEHACLECKRRFEERGVRKPPAAAVARSQPVGAILPGVNSER